MTISIRHLFLAMVCMGIFIPAPTFAGAEDTEAAVVMYHRFGEDDYPSTNIRIDQFEHHIDEMKTGGYTVLPLTEIVSALKEGRKLPPKTIAITVDDAYLSVYTEAWPRLKKAGFPFTLFVATEAVERASHGTYSRYMTWSQLKEMKDAGVEIGHHTVTHRHMPDADVATNQTEINDAFAKYERELNMRPTLFAYPYGEANTAMIQMIKESGFDAAFGQHSGGIGTETERFYLPRFALNESYGDLERFRLVASARPLPVSDIEPKDMQVSNEHNPPAIGFSLTREVKNAESIACYISGEGKVATENLGGVRIEIRPTQPFAKGRTRLNCTLSADDGRWYWFGRQFYLP